MKIYIVRHGETKSNKLGMLQGWTNTELSESGVELAIITGKGLKNIKFDIAFSSPLKRAYDTCKLILEENDYKDTKIIVDDRLKEINMGDYEGKIIKDPNNGIPKNVLNLFFTNPLKLEKLPNGEDAKMVASRMQNFLFDLVKKDYKNVLIATHGFSLRALLNFMYEDKNDFWQGGVPLNCAVNIIEYKDGKFEFIAKDKVYYDKSKCIDRYKI